MKFLATAIVALFVLLPSVTAYADNGDTAKWGEVGPWDIRVDRSVSDGCFAMAVYERGTTTRIGVNPESGELYIFLGDPSWKSLEVGKVYPVRVIFDNVKSYDGEMEGRRLGNAIFLMHRDVSTNFVKDFMQRSGMEVIYRGQSIARLSLKYSYAAFQEVLNCQKEFGFSKRPPSSRDPFVSAPPQTRDPFSQ